MTIMGLAARAEFHNDPTEGVSLALYPKYGNSDFG
jgi:hypothetical protein